MEQGIASRARTCPKWQVGGEAHFSHTAIQPAGGALHSELARWNLPRNSGESRVFSGFSTVFHEESGGKDEKNETRTGIDYVFFVGAGHRTRRIGRAAKKRILHA